VEQSIDQQCLLDFGKTPLPVENSVLCYTENSAYRIKPYALCPGLEYVGDEADGLFDPGQKTACCLGEKISTGFATENSPLAMFSS